MTDGRPAGHKVVDRAALKAIIERLKSEGRTIVLTNGCFDVLHVGHVRYIEAARALGDCLVIGVNTDEGVRRLKGPNRPLVPELDRAEVVAALEAVDYVTVFGEETPAELIRAIQPHIHVKGGDYKADDLPEAEAVRACGGRIVILPLVEGRSTSGLLERILRSGG